MESTVSSWVGHVRLELAYASLTRSLQHKWKFLLRVVSQCSPLFRDLGSFFTCFLPPAMFGLEMSTAEWRLFAFPLQLGGLGICDPVSLACHLYDTSVDHLIQSIINSIGFELESHFECVAVHKVDHRQCISRPFKDEFGQVLSFFDSLQQRTILCAKDSNISSWLSVLPFARDQFDLSAQEFCDGLALLYKKPLLSMPSVCDRCGAHEQSLDCRFGGLIGFRHNEASDAFGDLTSLVWSPVTKEPVVCDGVAGVNILIADLCVCRVWELQIEALFDIRVIDTDAWSSHARTPQDVLQTGEGEKKRKYLQICFDQHATFTPLHVSVDGMLGCEAEFLLRNRVTFLLQSGKCPMV